MDSGSFTWSMEWQLPFQGTFECDFMHLIDLPDPKDQISTDQFDTLMDYLKKRVKAVDTDELAKSFVDMAD